LTTSWRQRQSIELRLDIRDGQQRVLGYQRKQNKRRTSVQRFLPLYMFPLSPKFERSRPARCLKHRNHSLSHARGLRLLSLLLVRVALYSSEYPFPFCSFHACARISPVFRVAESLAGRQWIQISGASHRKSACIIPRLRLSAISRKEHATWRLPRPRRPMTWNQSMHAPFSSVQCGSIHAGLQATNEVLVSVVLRACYSWRGSRRNRENA
jgi:endogenous inhibitor of DNA gyrase (YacG/DUF329 family)